MPLASDGSMAAFVPARRALAWQLSDAGKSGWEQAVVDEVCQQNPGYGCVEFTLDLKAGIGRGLFYQKFRNRLDVDIPLVTQIPVKSRLTFSPPT